MQMLLGRSKKTRWLSAWMNCRPIRRSSKLGSKCASSQFSAKPGFIWRDTPAFKPVIASLRIRIVGSLFMALTIGMHVYPMDSANYLIEHKEESGMFEARSHEESQRIGVLGYSLFKGETAFIATLKVEKDCRQSGVGSALMRTALDHFATIGMQKVKLQAVGQGMNAQEREANTERLHTFYKRFGFGEPDDFGYMMREV